MKKIPFAVVKMVNIVLLMIPFLICWTLYYEPRTTTVGSKQVSVLVMIIFFLICYYFGQRLDCFRVSILQIRDVIFGEVLASIGIITGKIKLSGEQKELIRQAVANYPEKLCLVSPDEIKRRAQVGSDRTNLGTNAPWILE